MSTWIIDTAHTEIGFKVKHLVISTVSGKFTKFEGKLEGDPADLTNAQITFTADIDSITTGNEQRDGHLKSADFFDAASHPKLSFKSTAIVGKGDNEYKVTGDLTIRNTTKPITLNVEFGGVQNDLYGQTVAGFEITGKINRQEYGLSWSAVTEAGGIVVADDVKLIINAELVKQVKEAATA
ncbi:MAG TPA: YceI family protein [Chitinophagaceae bacterium]|mgnify:CR=1 FL=1|nr:YceI family protein [Chitinophagaceae bacterium]